MKLMKLGKLAGLMLGAIVALTMVGCGQSSRMEEATTFFKEMNTVDMEGTTVDKSTFNENKLTMVNIWATWCSPCIDELPALEKLHQEYSSKGVALKGLVLDMNSDHMKAAVEDILDKANVTYPQLVLSEAMQRDKFITETDGIPATYFLDSEGNVIKEVTGSRDYEEWKAYIEEMLKEVEGNA